MKGRQACLSLPAVCVVSAAMGLAPSAPAQSDLAALLDGVKEIAAPGWPGTVCAFGEPAFPVVLGGAGGALRAPVIAAARWEQGRVVIFGHDGYLGEEALATADTGRLMANAVRWVAGAKEPRVAVRALPGLLAFLTQRGLAAEALEGAGWAERLSGFSLLCLHPNSIATPAESAAVASFVRSGGGLISGDTGWGWLQLHPGKTLTEDHPGNRLLAAAGLTWADGGLDRTAPAGFAAEAAPSALTHAGRALDAIAGGGRGKEELAQAAWTLTQAARALPPDDALLLPRLRRLEAEHAAEAIPTAEKPLTMEQAAARLALTLQLQELRRLPPERITPHPAAASFPGAVPADAPRVTRTVRVDTAVPAWHSTGLYAAPGELIEVRVPETAAGKGLQVRIGAHSDGLWGLASWKRCPEICTETPLTSPSTRAANAFGGPIYLDVPAGCRLGEVTAEIRGAVEAPHFVLGRTDPAAWRAEVRQRPAPWAELETSKVILTVPSAVVRNLDQPVELMELWVHVLDSCAELAARPLEREQPERYVTDVQISAGYMHSGYPIMTFLDVAPVFVDRARIVANGHGGVWGFFHEMGHNHQSGDWTFDGTGEVTENLFSLYVFDRVCGLRTNAHPAMAPEARAKRRQEYLAGGAKFEQWKRDPFLALTMYAELQEAFGWEAYRRVFAEYRALPADRRPKTDDEKRDQWLARFSRAVGRNLGPFFQAWGVPTSDAARAAVTGLPPWMPEDWPPK